MNRFLYLLLMLACSFAAQAASPAYNTSTGVVSPTQFLKIDAAELKVMGNPVSTNSVNLYNSNGTLTGARTVDGNGLSLAFDDFDGFSVKNAASSRYFDIDLDTDFANIFLGDSGLQSTINLFTGTGYAGLWIAVSGTDRTKFSPYEVDGSTAYVFDTSLTHASGNLVEVKNNGTNVFVIPFDGIIPDLTINNITIENNITVKGNATLNVVTAMSETVTNNLTVHGNYIGTIDPTVTGTVLKLQKSLKLQFPRYIDGAGCTYANTNDYTALTFMVPQFSGTAATNVNNCDFAFRVPGDLDTSKDLTGVLTIRLTAADTASHTYNVGMVNIAASQSAEGTPANYVELAIAGDPSGASGDIETLAPVTLTAWRSNLTAGNWCLVRLNRDGGDSSTVASNLMELEIFYWATQ